MASVRFTWLVSAYCWVVLTVNTVVCVGLAWILEPIFGHVIWHRFLRCWARGNLRAGFVSVKVARNGPTGQPLLLAANHQSVFDIVVLAALLDAPVYFAAREDLFELPIIGLVLRRGRHIRIRRKASGSHRDALAAAVDRLRSGARVVFFPEGSRSPEGHVRPFRPGVFRVAATSGQPLIPVAIAGTGNIIRRSSRVIHPGRCRVMFLEPVPVGLQEAVSSAFRGGVAARIRSALAILDARDASLARAAECRASVPIGRRRPDQVARDG